MNAIVTSQADTEFSSPVLLENGADHQFTTPPLGRDAGEIHYAYDISGHTKDGDILATDLLLSEDGGASFQSIASGECAGGDASVVIPGGTPGFAGATVSRSEGVYSQDGGKTWTTVRGISNDRLQLMAADGKTKFGARAWPFTNPIVRVKLTLRSADTPSLQTECKVVFK